MEENKTLKLCPQIQSSGPVLINELKQVVCRLNLCKSTVTLPDGSILSVGVNKTSYRLKIIKGRATLHRGFGEPSMSAILLNYTTGAIKFIGSWSNKRKTRVPYRIARPLSVQSNAILDPRSSPPEIRAEGENISSHPMAILTK